MVSDLPKVMVIAINAWREDATSHTLMSIFSCWDPDKLSMVYTRADLPNTKVSGRFFQISENDVLKNLFRPLRQIGKEVYNTVYIDKKILEDEHNRYSRAREKHSYFMRICREIVWALGHWRSKALRVFVRDVAPELIFIPIYPVIYMAWIQRYILRLTGKPFVCYLADDNYTYSSCKGVLSYIHRFFLRGQVRWLAGNCREMFVIVNKEKEETDRLFGTNSVILTKGLDFSSIHFEKYITNNTLRFVYAGNLIIGRDKTLALLADILNKLHDEGARVQLNVYSPDKTDEETMNRINAGCSRYCGFVPREQVSTILHESDVVVFAEALEGKERHAARLSFSTKITDYLANSKCILAIGVKDIAPIDYFIRNDAAIIATDASEIESSIRSILNDPTIIEEYGHKAFLCAMRNHNKVVIDQRFIRTMILASKGDA